jgi:hypothetical protein
MQLTRSDIESLSSLQNLNTLSLDCEIEKGAGTLLSNRKSLKHLTIRRFNDELLYGRDQLVSLKIVKPVYSIWSERIKHYCPNLQYLDVKIMEERPGICDRLKRSIKDGMKRLASFKLNGKGVRLGTDWTGNPRDRRDD